MPDKCGQFATAPGFLIRAALQDELPAVMVRSYTVIRNPHARGTAMNDTLAIKVREVIAGHFGINPERLTDESRLRDDLGADWLDRLELMIAIEDQVAGFEIADFVVDRIDTVGDLMRAIEDAATRGVT
jgi:acyl carrier protein